MFTHTSVITASTAGSVSGGERTPVQDSLRGACRLSAVGSCQFLQRLAIGPPEHLPQFGSEIESDLLSNPVRDHQGVGDGRRISGDLQSVASTAARSPPPRVPSLRSPVSAGRRFRPPPTTGPAFGSTSEVPRPATDVVARTSSACNEGATPGQRPLSCLSARYQGVSAPPTTCAPPWSRCGRGASLYTAFVGPVAPWCRPMKRITAPCRGVPDWAAASLDAWTWRPTARIRPASSKSCEVCFSSTAPALDGARPVSPAMRSPHAVRPGPPGCTRRARPRRHGRPRPIRRTPV